jgi:hypothetical protein
MVCKNDQDSQKTLVKNFTIGQFPLPPTGWSGFRGEGRFFLAVFLRMV